MTTRLSIIILALAMIIVSGCTEGESRAKQNFDFSSIDRIAVVDVIGDMSGEAAKNQIADMISMELLSKGYSPVERAQVQSLLKEQKFQMSDLSSDAGVARAGQILNVPVVMVVNVPKFRDDVSMTAKMINVEDGSILWLGQGTGKGARWLTTVLGAAGGAAAGMAISGEDDQTAAAVIGGALGGAVAYGLSPQEADKAKEIIKKMCKTMPSRL